MSDNAPATAPAPPPAPARQPVFLDMGNLPAPTSADAPQTVPYSRFHDVIQARSAAQANAQALQAKLDTEAARVADYEKRWTEAETWKTQLETATEKHARELAELAEGYELKAIGFEDADLVEAARWAYARTPEDGRPTFVDALKLWQATPDAAPPILRPHLAKPAQAAEKAPEQAPAPKGYQWPSADRGASTQPPAPAQARRMDATEYARLRAEGKSANDIARGR